jgi:hypothetical protein
VVYRPFILLLGVFLSSHMPAAGQTPAPRSALALAHVVPVNAILPMVSTRLPAASFTLSQEAGKSSAHYSFVFAGAYEHDYTLDHLSPMDEVKTLILTQSSLPLVRLWGGRLQLDAFQSTPHLQNVQFGAFGYGGMRGSRLLGQSYPGAPRSLRLSGLTLTLHFGRDDRAAHPVQLWRRLTGVLTAVLN